MFGLRLMFVFFWFSSSFFVFLVVTLKKLKKIKVFLVFWRKSYLKKGKKTKKLKVFLVFSWIVHTFLLNIWPKNQKTWVFLFFALLQFRLPSKNQKKPKVFCFLENLKPKKPNVFLFFRESKPKKPKNSRKTLTWNQNFSKKFCFFGFLVFSRFRKHHSFCWKRRVLLREEFLRLYTTFWKYKIDAKKRLEDLCAKPHQPGKSER